MRRSPGCLYVDFAVGTTGFRCHANLPWHIFSHCASGVPGSECSAKTSSNPAQDIEGTADKAGITGSRSLWMPIEPVFPPRPRPVRLAPRDENPRLGFGLASRHEAGDATAALDRVASIPINTTNGVI